jgi:hypothetical protein
MKQGFDKETRFHACDKCENCEKFPTLTCTNSASCKDCAAFPGCKKAKGIPGHLICLKFDCNQALLLVTG